MNLTRILPGKKALDYRRVITISAGHLFHDMYNAVLPPLWPLLISSLDLNLSAVGLVTSISRLPFIFNPLIGYLSDRTGPKYFIILTPAVTATFMGLVGLSGSVVSLSILLFLSGFSSMVFHAAAPGAAAEAAKQRRGLGMGLFMAGGGLGRGAGAVMAVWAVSMWGLSGTARLMFIGWGVSAVLYFQLRDLPAPTRPVDPLRKLLPEFGRFFLPLALAMMLRAALPACLNTFLPLYLVQAGAPLWIAGAAISIIEISGVTGVLLLGPASDTMGRKKIITYSLAISAALVPLFLQTSGWLVFPALILLGFFNLSSGTLLMTLVQDRFTKHRATGNSIFVLISFLSNAVMLILIGFVGDQFSLSLAYLLASLATLLSLGILQLLPGLKREASDA